MCGIAGAVGEIDDRVEEAVRAMTQAEFHRGPDDSGWFSTGPGRGAVFGFRRLSILDLTPAGHQPMIDAARGNVLVFNGEIYNFATLRAELLANGEGFSSTSDSEVLLRGYGQWHEGVLQRLRGMYAFAIYDPARRSVFLARDRLGIKPLYVASVRRPGGQVTLFASELRALLASDLVPRRIDPVAVSSYLWNGFVVGPSTMIDGVSLMPAGSSDVLRLDAPSPRPTKYWSLPMNDAESERGTIEKLEAELATAARQHLVSDVPLGVFLSGGIDSSAVTAMAVREAGTQVKTFHVGFEEAGFDESHYARAVADALQTEHSEFRLTQSIFQNGLDKAIAGLDQPTFDAINTYFVSRIVREAGFTVALAGTGGDELFGGYRSFRDLPRARSAARAVRFVPDALLATLGRGASRLRARGPEQVPPQTRWAKLADMLRSGGDPVTGYQIAYALFTREFRALLAAPELLSTAPDGLPIERANELRSLTRGATALSAISALEVSLFLEERLLRDSDAASMAVSLELRVPLLDHRVVEEVARLPDSLRFEPVGRKALLRKLAMPKLPASLFDRPKAGFVLPIDVWAKDRLAPEIEAAFADRSLAERVGLDGTVLTRLFTAFRAGAPGLYWSRVWAPFVLLKWCRTHAVSLA